jgi:hypothetical protein
MLSASIFSVLVSGFPFQTSNPEDVEFQATQSGVDLPQRKSFPLCFLHYKFLWINPNNLILLVSRLIFASLYQPLALFLRREGFQTLTLEANPPKSQSSNLHCFFVIVELEMYRNMQLDLQALRMWLLRLFLYVTAQCLFRFWPPMQPRAIPSALNHQNHNTFSKCSLQPKSALLCVYRNAPILSHAMQPNSVPKHQHTIQYNGVQNSP